MKKTPYNLMAKLLVFTMMDEGAEDFLLRTGLKMRQALIKAESLIPPYMEEHEFIYTSKEHRTLKRCYLLTEAYSMAHEQVTRFEELCVN